jgi:hypothetical protein
LYVQVVPGVSGRYGLSIWLAHAVGKAGGFGHD